MRRKHAQWVYGESGMTDFDYALTRRLPRRRLAAFLCTSMSMTTSMMAPLSQERIMSAERDAALVLSLKG